MWIAPAVAHAAPTQDVGVWSSVALQADLDDEADTGPRLWLDLHGRRTASSFVGIVRPGVGWDLAKGVSVFAGYAWVPTVPDDPLAEVSNEHRAWEQALLSTRMDGVQLALRPRLEQRFLAGDPDIALRARAWVRAGIPVTGPVSLSVWDEVFLGLNETDWAVAGFDQNRVFVGPAFALEEHGRVEIGYLNAFLMRDSGDTLLHAVSASLLLHW